VIGVTTEDPRLLSATALRQRLRDGALSSVEITEAHIAQIQRVNPTLNAMVCERFAQARAEAAAADAALRETDAPEWTGLPCSIKECFALTGMPNASGLVARRDRRATEDATAVARYRAAGAIPLGVTNTSELCMWMESNNYLYGRTNNPYDDTRIVGGSSGGEGALIGAGAAPFGLGSDIGGSIRMPSFFCGIFGHKPTGGLVPGTGQHPMADPGACRYLSTGPMCRRAEDLMPLLAVLAGPDGRDPGCEPRELGDPAEVALAGRPLIHIADNGRQPVSGALRQAQEAAAAALTRRGMDVRNARLSALRESAEIWSCMLAEASEVPFGTLLGEGTPIQPLWELAKWTIRRSDHTLLASLLALTNPWVDHFPAYRDRMVEAGRSLREELCDLLGPDGVLLLPSFPRTAPRHYHPALRQVMLRFDFAYTAILNVMEIPVTQVPLGLDDMGLPLGVQVGAQHGGDHVTIAVAMALEEEFGGWVPPKRWF